jgi:hypothetical protein
MPTLITQDEFEPNLLPNPNLTMDIIVFVATLPVAQFPKMKFQQLTLFGRMAPPSPETKSVQVQGHNHGSRQVHSRLYKINARAHGNKKETKTTKSKK